MDRNAYRDDNGTDQPRTLTDQPRASADQPWTRGEQRETYPDQREAYPDEPDTYWRRRIVTLVTGLGLLGLLAWAFSGGGGKPAPSPHGSPASGTLSAPANPGALGSASGASPASPASPAASASATAGAAGADAAVPGLASPGTSGLPATKASATGSSRSAGPKSTSSANAAQAASTEPGGGRCSPSAVVLSLFSSSRSYPAGQSPEFGVDAVSTAPGTCTFDLGPTQLHLIVMSAGRVIWDSADCARGSGTQPARLTRGVPVEEYFTWNRAITLPGCVTLASSARPGSYQAQAKTTAITSGTFTFKLIR